MREQSAMQILKQALRDYLHRYPEERLAMLLAHAQSGKLAWCSCCCFIGVATADHPLRGRLSLPEIGDTDHLRIAAYWPGAVEANEAYARLGAGAASGALSFLSENADERRRRILIPMVRAEMKRREALRAAEAHQEQTELVG